MTFPNLVIGGAPKCGTSSLFSWLADHPQVCGSADKEPFFLMDRDNPLRSRDCNVHDHGLEAYGSLFPDCRPDHRIVVEATTHYIYQSTALEQLAGLESRPRVVFLLRKPSERIYSSFAYSRNKGRLRSDLTFPEFVRLIRAGPGPAPPDWAWGASAYVLPRDIQYSRYIEYLERWRERLGDERLRILSFEQLRADPRSAVRELCGWLGLDPGVYDDYDFATRNRTIAVRSPRAHGMAQALASRLPLGAIRTPVKRLYSALQSKRGGEARTPADLAALAELDSEFRADNERLARAFDLDLEAWDQPPR